MWHCSSSSHLRPCLGPIHIHSYYSVHMLTTLPKYFLDISHILLMAASLAANVDKSKGAFRWFTKASRLHLFVGPTHSQYCHCRIHISQTIAKYFLDILLIRICVPRSIKGNLFVIHVTEFFVMVFANRYEVCKKATNTNCIWTWAK